MPSCRKPGETNILFNSDVGYVYPHRCWSCMVPCLIREDFVLRRSRRQDVHLLLGRCRWTHKVAFAAEYEGRPTPAMGRFSGRREWEDCYHGWDVADAIKDLGFVRTDGKTLVPQPHLRFDDEGHVDARPRAWPHARQPAAGFRALTPERSGTRRSPNTARASRSTPATRPDCRSGAARRPPFSKTGCPPEVARGRQPDVLTWSGAHVGRGVHKVRFEPWASRWKSRRARPCSRRRSARASP